MTKLDSTLWLDMMQYLRQRHAPICRQWFEELEPMGLDSGLLKVRTTTAVQQQYLQRRCVTEFREAAQAVTGALIAVQFVDGAGSADAGADSSPGSGGGAIYPPSHGNHTHPAPAPAPGAPGAPGAGTPTNHAAAPKPAPGSRLPIWPRPEPAPLPEPHRGEPLPDRRGEPVFNDQILLSPDYTFETFVRGPENQLAYAAAVAVANQPGTAYNPLFIHGGVGLGKTHLLQGICQSVLQRNPLARVCYLSCENFVNDFLNSVQHNLMQDFRDRYRRAALLVIDDIQFLSNRERTQEEFFHTFNELYQAKKQIVLSSDAPPTEIPQLEERLVSRFKSGLVADVSKPSFETRVAIVRAKVRLRGIEMPEDVVNFVADRIESNARELEGAIITLQGHAALKNLPITAQLAQEVFGNGSAQGLSGQVTLQQIIDAVTVHYNVKLSDLQSKRRQKSIAEPRQVCMWLARRRTRFSLQEIGAFFGGRDHTTVMHSLRTVDDRMVQDPGFLTEINRLDDRVSRMLKPGMQP